MKRLLGNLKSKPPEIRLIVAGICAFIVTGAIAAGWILVPGPQKNSQSKKAVQTSTPLNALVDSVGGVIKNSSLGGKEDSEQVQIIDAGQSSEYQLHDETNPYQP